MANISKIRLSGQTYTIVDETAIHSLQGYSTTAEMNQAITAATDALAQTIVEQDYQTESDVTAITSPINATLTAHTADTTIHVTASDKANWNAKADVADIPSVTAYADAVQYNSTSHYVEFYHGGTGGTKVFEYDASPFIVDGMVSNVEVKNATVEGQTVLCLVISFNTDAGKQDINIPISQIFDADNYYTTAQTQSYVTGYTYDKATIDQKVAEGGTFNPTLYYDKTATDALLAAKADTATTYTKTEVDNAITAATASKQDTLVSGTNIKTVGGATILGSGNIALMTASIGSGNDSETLIFDFA